MPVKCTKTANFHAGELVRVRSRPDLGEIVLVEVFRGEHFVDTGFRVAGKRIPISWPAEDLISTEEAS